MTMPYWRLTRPPPRPLWFETSKYQNSIRSHLTQHPVKSSWIIRKSFNLVPLSTVTQMYAAFYSLVFPAAVGLTATGPAMGLDFLPEESFKYRSSESNRTSASCMDQSEI